MHWKYFQLFLLVGIACFWRCSCGESGHQGELQSDKVILRPGRVRAVGSSVTMQANYLCYGNENTTEIWSWYRGKNTCLGSSRFKRSCFNATSDCNVSPSRTNATNEFISCEEDGTVFTLKMVYSDLMLEDSEVVVLKNGKGTEINSLVALDVKYCDDLNVTQADIFNITNAKQGRYGTMALYFCNVSGDHDVMVDGKKEDNPYNRSCQGDASWTGHNKVECWFAPKDVTVRQRSDYATKSANFECNHTAGFPKNVSEKYNIGGDEGVDQSHILSSEDHLKEYYCTVENDYGPLQSSIKILTVFFAPENLDVDAWNQVIPVNESKDLKFSFNANSKNGTVATVHKPDGRLENMTCRLQTGSNTSYVCNFTLTVISADDYGTYNFTATTSDPNGSNSTSVGIFKSVNDIPTTTASIPDTTIGKEKNPNYALIGGLCGAALLLIILLLVFLLVRRRRLKKSSENSVKEERINEIYGSAPASTTNHGNATGSTQAKEERQNVLYVSSGDPGGIEEAYAEVGKKKNKKSNGNDNSAFSPEVTEVTYAAVNKPKKKKKPEDPQEAVYSAVDKKKKTKGAKGESDLHGAPTIDV